MKRLLHIIASPREEKSRTLQVSRVFLKQMHEQFPDYRIDELNLAKEEIPLLTTKRVDGKYMLLDGKDLYGEAKEAWELIVQHIRRFLAADVYLVSTPMWNFSIPYLLKHYIDVIVQPNYLFRYTENGVEGLAKNKKMFVITSRGGDYQIKGQEAMDLQEPYLRLIFGFIGIQEIAFLKVEPMDKGKELREKKLAEAKEKVTELLSKL